MARMNLFWWIWPSPRNKKEDIEIGFPLQMLGSRNDLIRTMACLDQTAPIHDLRVYYEVYFKYIEGVLHQVPQEILGVIQTPSITSPSTDNPIQRSYKVLHALSQMLSDDKSHLLLRTACSQLYGQSLIITDFAQGVNAISRGSSETIQLIFILLGVLTMFYDPIPNPEQGLLQLRRSDSSFKLYRRSTTTWEVDSQSISELGQDISFDDLLCRYSRHVGPIPSLKVQQQNIQSFGILRSEDVSFYTLAKLLKVEIVWTNSICEHLEFNVRTSQLKLFRFPSFCALLCSQEPERTFLDGLFKHLLEDGSYTSANFFREIICTYRLIFGQHKDARKLIRNICLQGRLWGFRSPFKKAHPSALLNEWADPLLEELCFKDSRNVGIFSELDILDLKNVYVLDTDFPYFADRLAILRSFVEHQLPQDWRVLWRDRRDVTKFWTVWAVVLFGVPTLFLAVIQTILTGLQLRT